MLIHGMLLGVAVVAIAAKFSPKALKLMLGYQGYIDLVMHCGIILVGTMTGTFSGMMATAIAGLCISATLSVVRRVWGYAKYQGGKVVYFAPVWTIESVTRSVRHFFTKTLVKVKSQVEAGLENGNVVHIADYKPAAA